VKLGLEKLEVWGKPVVILGAGETGKLLVHILQREWGLGYKPLAVFDFRLAPKGRVLEGVPYGGTVTDALNLAQKQRIDTVIFAMTHVRRQYLARFVEGARSGFRHVIVIPNLIGITTSAVTASDLAGVFGVEIKQNLLSPWTLRIKRMLDLVATVTGGILILPLLLAISFLLWVSSRGGVFYRAQRIGQDGKHFSCLKFRTMVPEAEATLQRMLEENAELRGEYSKYHKLRDDPRITRIGRFLRKTSLDELPQLWNVLRGEMSLVGPRPYLARETEEIQDALHGERSMIGLGLYLPPDYKESRPTQNEILRVPPGITGPWQVAGRNHTSFRERVHMDAYYVRNWSIWIDLIILARTVGILIFGRGAF
jgi:Undecaprenyl-phosphate galactose phosphotransferase WbaP